MANLRQFLLDAGVLFLLNRDGERILRRLPWGGFNACRTGSNVHLMIDRDP